MSTLEKIFTKYHRLAKNMLIDLQCLFCSNVMLLPLFYGVSFAYLSSSIIFVPLLYLLLHGIAAFLIPVINHVELAYFITFGLALGYVGTILARPMKIFPQNPKKEPRKSLIYLLWLLLSSLAFIGIDSELDTGFPIGLIMALLVYLALFMLFHYVSYLQDDIASQNYSTNFEYHMAWWIWEATLIPFFITGGLSISTLITTALGGVFSVGLMLAKNLLYPAPVKSI